MLWLPISINTTLFEYSGQLFSAITVESFSKYTAMPKVVKSKVVQHKTCDYEEETDQGETHVVKPSLPSFTLKPENPKRMILDSNCIDQSFIPLGGKFYYGLRIVTGSQPGAAANTRTVVLGLTGTEGTTGKITVDAKWFLFTHTHFKKSTYDDLVIECEDDLGEIQVVLAGLRYSRTILTPDWYIDFFTVCNYQSSIMKNYPCYHWIGKKVKGVTATSATGKLVCALNNIIIIITATRTSLDSNL